MAEPVRLQIRCSENARKEWARVAAAVDMNYGEFAEYAALFIEDNTEEFEEFVESGGRVRSRSRRL